MPAIPNLVGLEGIIESRPVYREGRPYIAGTGVSVARIGVLYSVDGLSAEDIAEAKSLPLDHVYAALAYYLRNKQAIDDDIRAQDEETHRIADEYYAEHGRLPKR